MPTLVRKLLLFAAVDGLILQPAPPKNHRPATEQAIKISYKSNAVNPLLKDRRDEDTAQDALEVHGIVGLLKVSSSSFLISISRREQVALIKEKPVYSIAEVALIPLSTQEDAKNAIIKARDSQQARAQSTEDFLSSSSDEDDDENFSLADDSSLQEIPQSSEKKSELTNSANPKSIAADVIAKKGVYGRFTDRWFSKKGWNDDQRQKHGLSKSQDDLPKPENLNVTTQEPTSIANEPSTNDKSAEVSVITESSEHERIPMLPKILTTTKIFFGSRNFFFSYDYDLSRPAIEQTELIQSQLPHKTFDPLFFWNKHLLKPFTDAGQEEFTIPLIQGFVGQRKFTAHETSSKSFLLTLISRRSVNRAGLRYLRRGIDEDGFVANSVETEQILSSPTWDTNSSKLYSWVQYRGSIPLFFSQSPYSLKPIPIVRGSPETNYQSFEQHIKQLIRRYGKVQVASLVEKKGPEGTVGRLFEQAAESYITHHETSNDTRFQFEWFDFHSACKGMRFENVSLLFDIIKESLDSFGWNEVKGSALSKKQDGVLRTNCMDCLDRTNVVQSACGRLVLEKQLEQEGVTIDLQHDASTSWFNTLWADNGDAISRQYAGTAALKGDFTRTRKRNISGALTDFGLTLSRYYNNIVNDYFTQALIDYVLGKADETIFTDFEADMKSQDYAIDLRKVRQNAIETSSTICIENSNEHLVSGWVLSTPRISNSLKALPFEECVILLTEEALYFVRMDWTVEKVKSFEKVELDSITSLGRGVYITSTLASRDLDEKKNVGFMVKWSTKGRPQLIRVNTRSLTAGENENILQTQQQQQQQTKNSQSDKYMAFKALPPKSYYVAANPEDVVPPSEIELVRTITDDIARLLNIRKSISISREVPVDERPNKIQDTSLIVEEEDVISLTEAKKSTGYLETITHSLKRLVWA